MAELPETELRYALRNLRHLYEQMLSGHVKDNASAAKGLLGPAIERLEKFEQKLIAALAEDFTAEYTPR